MLAKLKNSINAVEKSSWNEIALSLTDQQCFEAIPVILDFLEDPRTAKSRGTLLYALQQYTDYPEEYKERTLLVATLLEETGGFEVEFEAGCLLDLLA